MSTTTTTTTMSTTTDLNPLPAPLALCTTVPTTTATAISEDGSSVSTTTSTTTLTTATGASSTRKEKGKELTSTRTTTTSDDVPAACASATTTMDSPPLPFLTVPSILLSLRGQTPTFTMANPTLSSSPAPTWAAASAATTSKTTRPRRFEDLPPKKRMKRVQGYRSHMASLGVLKTNEYPVAQNSNPLKERNEKQEQQQLHQDHGSSSGAAFTNSVPGNIIVPPPPIKLLNIQEQQPPLPREMDAMNKKKRSLCVSMEEKPIAFNKELPQQPGTTNRDFMNAGCDLTKISYGQSQEKQKKEASSRSNRLQTMVAAFMQTATIMKSTVVSTSPIHEVWDSDVLIGVRRGKCFDHPGNLVFHEWARQFHDIYAGAKSNLEKTTVTSFLVQAVYRRGGRFLRRHDCEHDLAQQVSYLELTPEQARLKTRDLLIRVSATAANKKKNNKSSKKKKTLTTPTK